MNYYGRFLKGYDSGSNEMIITLFNQSLFDDVNP